MADAIERLLDDPERARRMGAALRVKAMAMLDPAAADRAQIAAYEALLTAESR
jgi:glycosyltransferase involved in cell wall biosynthesis